MAFRNFAPALALAATACLSPLVASAECSTADTAARCIRVTDVPAQPSDVINVAMTSASSAPSSLVSVGEVLPRGQYSIILNAEYYGLPRVSDGWVYMKVGQDAYRVDWRSHEVLERVTDRTSANF